MNPKKSPGMWLLCLLFGVLAINGCEQLTAQDAIDEVISILQESPPDVVAGRNADDEKLLQIVATVAVSQYLGESAQADEVKAMAQSLVSRIGRMPLRKAFVLRQVKQELREEGLWVPGVQIDWEAIGDFIIKIAPVIFQLIELFIGIAGTIIHCFLLASGYLIHFAIAML